MQFKTRAILGVGFGIVMMLIGSATAAPRPESFLVGAVLWIAGWGLAIWGCVNYARWKGYSGWFGLLGYLLLPGLVILACFPNKRKRTNPNQEAELPAEMDALVEQDQVSGHRYLLALLPLGVFAVAAGGFLLLTKSNVDPAEWKTVAPAGAGFQALMPGTPQTDQSKQKTPAGTIDVQKLAAWPKGKKEMFMIVAIRFPDEAGTQLGGAEKLLDIGRQDFLAAAEGQLQSEKPVVLSGHPGRELEVLPPQGAAIKSRIFATHNRIYQVTAYVSKIRLASADVQKFFDAFEILAESGAATERTDSEAPPEHKDESEADPPEEK